MMLGPDTDAGGPKKNNTGQIPHQVMAPRNDNAGEMTVRRRVHRGAFCFLVLFYGQVSFAFPLFRLKVVKWVSDMKQVLSFPSTLLLNLL